MWPTAYNRLFAPAVWQESIPPFSRSSSDGKMRSLAYEEAAHFPTKAAHLSPESTALFPCHPILAGKAPPHCWDTAPTHPFPPTTRKNTQNPPAPTLDT